jgi:CPA2 family monovalent cation:H+ antiporter-2
MIKYTDRAYLLFEKSLPTRLRAVVETNTSKVDQIVEQGAWAKFIKIYFFRVFGNAVLVVAAMIVTSKYVMPLMGSFFPSVLLANSVGLIISLIVAAPFFWALVFRPFKGEVIQDLWQSRRNRALLILFQVARIGLAITLFVVLAPQFISISSAIGIALGFILLMFLFFSKHFDAVYHWIENRFILNLNQRDDVEQKSKPQLAPWDAQIVYMELSPNSEIAGKTLEELKIRERFGVSIVLVERGLQRIAAPSRAERLYPFDRLSLVGTNDQILSFKTYLDASILPADSKKDLTFSLFAYTVDKNSTFKNKSIRSSGLREQTSGLVVGIERGSKRLLNPDSSEEIKEGDLV